MKFNLLSLLIAVLVLACVSLQAQPPSGNTGIFSFNPSAQFNYVLPPIPLQQLLLSQAIADGSIGNVQTLIYMGADLNYVYYDNHNYTPLHLAVRSGNYSIIQLILERLSLSGGIPTHVNPVDVVGNTPLRLALQRPEYDDSQRTNNDHIIELLLNHGASINNITHFIRIAAT